MVFVGVRDGLRSEHSPAAPCCHCTDRDLDRMNRELSTLRDHKKRLEEAVVVSVVDLHE